MALWIFWRKLHWTGGTGYMPLSDGFGTWFSHLILPWTVLALLYMAIYARMTRNNLLETLGEDYIRTARAKGLSERQVIFKHGLRASLTPIVTLFGLDVALLVGGAIITESVFNLQGLGWLAINGAINQELPQVLGVVSAHGDGRRDHEPRGRHRLRVPRSTCEVRVTAVGRERSLRATRLPRRSLRMSAKHRCSTSVTSRSASRRATASSRRSPSSRSRCGAARRSASSASPARARASRASRSWGC